MDGGRKEKHVQEQVQQKIKSFHSYSKSVRNTSCISTQLTQKRLKNEFHSYAKLWQQDPGSESICMEASQPPQATQHPQASYSQPYFTQADDQNLKNHRVKWTDEEKEMLVSVVKKIDPQEQTSWNCVAKMMNKQFNTDRPGVSCRRAYERMVKEAEQNYMLSERKKSEIKPTKKCKKRSVSEEVKSISIKSEDAKLTDFIKSEKSSPEASPERGKKCKKPTPAREKRWNDTATVRQSSRIKETQERKRLCQQKSATKLPLHRHTPTKGHRAANPDHGQYTRQTCGLSNTDHNQYTRHSENSEEATGGKQDHQSLRTHKVSNHDHGLYALRHMDSDPPPSISVLDSHRLMQAVLTLSSTQIAQVTLSIPSLRSALQQQMCTERRLGPQDSRTEFQNMPGLWQHDYC